MKKFKNTFIETPGTDTVSATWFFRVLIETKRILGSDYQVVSALSKIPFNEYGKIKKSDLFEATKDTVDYEYLRKALEEESVDIREAWQGILDFRRYYIEQLKKMDIESPGIDAVKVEWLLYETRTSWFDFQIKTAVSKIAVDEHGKIKKSDLFEVTKNTIGYEYLRSILEKEPVEIRKAWQEENQTKQHYNLFIEGYKGSWMAMDSSKIDNVRYCLLVNEYRSLNMPNIIADMNGNIIEEFNDSDFFKYFEKFIADKANTKHQEEVFDPYVSDGSMSEEDYELMHKNILESQPTITQAENLAEGWQWNDYIDGSGHLESPHGESYFSYDFSSNEVQPAENQFQELESTKVETPRLFVDMDGTLAVFKPVDTLETLYEKGYFESLEPQQNVVDAVKLVIAQNPDVEVFILSAVLTDSEFAQADKNAWLDNHLPEINADHRIFVPCGEDKKAFINDLKQSDFLLDDYTKNLTLWEPPAIGIKLINGINDTHGTWQGKRVSYEMPPQELQHHIINHMNVVGLKAERDFLFKDTSKYINKEPQQLHPGNIIHSKVNLPVYSKEMSGKLFVVNDVSLDGSFNAYKLTSNSSRELLPHAIAIKADNYNHLTQDSFIASNELFEFTADWKYTKLNGKLTQEQMLELTNASRQAEQIVISFGKDMVLTDNDKSRQIVENLFNNFERDPKVLAEYLAFKAKFHNFSQRNSMLIYSQNPHSTFVASKTKFQELGYKIQPHQQSKPIKALKPVKTQFFYRPDGSMVFMSKATNEEKAKIKSGQIKVQSAQAKKYSYYNLYDISQTDCPKSDYPKLYSMGVSSEQHNEYYNKIVNLMERMDINVMVKDMRSISLTGVYNKLENSITINNLLGDTQKLSTMCHEAAHALLHKTSTASTEVKEFEAQCVSILFQSELGLPLENNDVEYLCKYLSKAKPQNSFNLKESLDRITKQVGFLKRGIGLDNKETAFFNKDLAKTQQRGAHLKKEDSTISLEH